MSVRRMDRRALFASGAAAALLAATGVSAEALPRRGGRIRIAVPRGDGSFAAVARLAVFETLTEVSPDGLLRPGLAVSWQADAEARDWLLTLRADAVFHDGHPCTPVDVIASLQRGLEPDAVVRAEPEDVGGVRITLAQGDPQFPWLLADPAVMVTPGGEVSADMAEWNGTGLYRVARGDSDRHFLAYRVASHARDGQAGWVDSIEVVTIPDAGVRAEALRDGHVDVAVLPAREGLKGRGRFLHHPDEGSAILVARPDVVLPPIISNRAALDDGRIAERWWMA